MKKKIWIKIRENKGRVVLILVALAIVVAVGMAIMDFYPIASVNGEGISGRRFWKNYRAATLYYENLKKTYPVEGDASSTVHEISSLEMRANVLDQLIEAELIEDGVKREVGSDFNYLVSSKVDRYDDSKSLQKAASSLYGMSYSDFRSEVLLPQAEKDVLLARFFLKGQKFEDWIIEARKRADVELYLDDLRWTGERVKTLGK